MIPENQGLHCLVVRRLAVRDQSGKWPTPNFAHYRHHGSRKLNKDESILPVLDFQGRDWHKICWLRLERFDLSIHAVQLASEEQDWSWHSLCLVSAADDHPEMVFGLLEAPSRYAGNNLYHPTCLQKSQSLPQDKMRRCSWLEGFVQRWE